MWIVEDVLTAILASGLKVFHAYANAMQCNAISESCAETNSMHMLTRLRVRVIDSLGACLRCRWTPSEKIGACSVDIAAIETCEAH